MAAPRENFTQGSARARAADSPVFMWRTPAEPTSLRDVPFQGGDRGEIGDGAQTPEIGDSSRIKNLHPARPNKRRNGKPPNSVYADFARLELILGRSVRAGTQSQPPNPLPGERPARRSFGGRPRRPPAFFTRMGLWRLGKVGFAQRFIQRKSGKVEPLFQSRPLSVPAAAFRSKNGAFTDLSVRCGSPFHLGFRRSCTPLAPFTVGEPG